MRMHRLDRRELGPEADWPILLQSVHDLLKARYRFPEGSGISTDDLGLDDFVKPFSPALKP
jgi:hypothetical protein